MAPRAAPKSRHPLRLRRHLAHLWEQAQPPAYPGRLIPCHLRVGFGWIGPDIYDELSECRESESCPKEEITEYRGGEDIYMMVIRGALGTAATQEPRQVIRTVDPLPI